MFGSWTAGPLSWLLLLGAVMSITPRGMSVQEAYKEYRAGNLKVNRRYQRKLVWMIDEKRALIDSVLHDYPIPLILLAFTTLPDGSRTFEILDGMQRLNALFGFIENGFDVAGKHFDVEQLARAKQMAAAGAFEAISAPDKLLSPKECANFLDYTLAVTEFPATNEDAVNEVFGRINSYGRRLSDQEKRQAGVVSGFANVVREIATEIRGDVSQDSLDLSEMPAISVDVAGESPNYGVKADETFWCKQGVLRRSQLRDSEDEQMIADLAITILQGKPFAFSGSYLDEFYSIGSDEYNEIENSLAAYGSTKLKSDLVGTLSILRETISVVDDGVNAFRKIVHPDAGSNPVKTAFFAVFFAFFQLYAAKKMSPAEPAAIMKAIADLQGKLEVAAGQMRSEPRQKNIDVTLGLIQKHFVKREPPVLDHGAGSAIPFENAIRRSRIESSAFECKQGLLRLDHKRTADVDLVEKIVETICGIANIGPDSSGAVFIGVADKKPDRDRIVELDNIVASEISSRYVVGIDREVVVMKSSIEKYKRNIVDKIAKSGLSEPVRSAVLAKIDCIVYRGHSVVCIWVPPQKGYSSVSDVVFIREGSSTKEVKGARALQAVFQRFGA
jgi:hypothetical protein